MKILVFHLFRIASIVSTKSGDFSFRQLIKDLNRDQKTKTNDATFLGNLIQISTFLKGRPGSMFKAV